MHHTDVAVSAVNAVSHWAHFTRDHAMMREKKSIAEWSGRNMHNLVMEHDGHLTRMAAAHNGTAVNGGGGGGGGGAAAMAMVPPMAALAAAPGSAAVWNRLDELTRSVGTALERLDAHSVLLERIAAHCERQDEAQRQQRR